MQLQTWVDLERLPLLESFNVHTEDYALAHKTAIGRVFVSEPYDEDEQREMVENDPAYMEVRTCIHRCYSCLHVITIDHFFEAS